MGEYAKYGSDNSNNSAASRKFGIDEKLVRDWRRKIDNIKSLPKTKCADRGRKCQWPELEKKVVEWVEENRKSGLAVTRNLIRLHAKKTAQQMNIDNFLVSSGWCTRFMKRNKLVLRQKTKISQLKLALELSKYRYQGYLFVFKIYCPNFILEFQIICLFYLTDEN